MRVTLDRLISIGGLLLAVVLLVAGGLLVWANMFIGNEVHDQLAAQKITMPTEETGLADLPDEDKAELEPYAGQQMTTGGQAKAYADHYIAVHLDAVADGKTYSEVSGQYIEQCSDPAAAKSADCLELSAQKATLFQGETLRGAAPVRLRIRHDGHDRRVCRDRRVRRGRPLPGPRRARLPARPPGSRTRSQPWHIRHGVTVALPDALECTLTPADSVRRCGHPVMAPFCVNRPCAVVSWAGWWRVREGLSEEPALGCESVALELESFPCCLPGLVRVGVRVCGGSCRRRCGVGPWPAGPWPAARRGPSSRRRGSAGAAVGAAGKPSGCDPGPRDRRRSTRIHCQRRGEAIEHLVQVAKVDAGTERSDGAQVVEPFGNGVPVGFWRGFSGIGHGRQVWVPGTRDAMGLAVKSCTFANVELRMIRPSHVELWVKSMAGRTRKAAAEMMRDTARPPHADSVRTRRGL
jgi:hypothetical protein